MRIYKTFALLARRVYRLFIHYNVEGSIPTDGPCVFVVHHQNLSGPVHALLTLPIHAHMWVYKVFLDRKECFKQYADYTFTKRFGMPRIVAVPLAWFISLFVPAILRSFSAIPVYRSTRNIVETFSISHTSLIRGESLIVAPDVDYDSDSSLMGEIYTGFLHLEKTYFKETKKHLSFIPMAYNAIEKKLVLAEAIRFDDDTPYAEQKDMVAERIRKSINDIKEPENIHKEKEVVS